ncbi:nucleoside hydrolase [Aurantibacter crassamenti]|uniref:nucleoside hydrolase n=1 Tax=Aurantibacter crassamenti TaxID=1837375 RepID=UPI00193AB993|nr:nucleoside hydrolase [Aurantibacter crassamenti]MBM1105543.1 nucleoside hydrolase [Aurantibacter crassamenti]
MKPKFFLLLTIISFFNIISCKEIKKDNPETSTESTVEKKDSRIKIIFDSDANNELDDQFAIAYMLLNGDVFDVKGITVNATRNDTDIQGHYDEAERVMQLCNMKDSLPLLKGAEGNFKEIAENFNPSEYDGKDGVDFMLEQTKKDSVIIVAVGKLTNIALAIKKDPSFTERTKIVWLGSNYPEPGEYNQDNDTIAMNYVLNSKIPFEMVTVRYGKPSGTNAVAVTKIEVEEKMAGLGPKAIQPIIGRHGGTFNNFGDYAANLFEHIFEHFGTDKVTPSRPLFDMVALSVLKNASWGETKSIPCPILINNQWVERPNNTRQITIWENFNRDAVIADFYDTMENPIFVKTAN